MDLEIPLAAQTAYADLVERSFAHAFEEAFAEEGSFVAKSVKGRRYWYFQTTGDAGRRQTYVGPETDELLQRIANHRGVRSDERDRRSVVSMLVRSVHLPAPERRIGDIISALERAGVFRLRAVLVGTVAYHAYPAMLGIRLPFATLQTSDIDLAQYRTISVASGDAIAPPLEILRQVDPSFRAAPHPSDSRRSTTYIATGGLRVDFLTPNRGPDSDAPQILPSLGTDAQPLRFLDYLIHEPVRATLLHEAGVPVIVPAPERYALHKLIVAQRRSGQEKRGKDLAQAEALLRVLTARRPTALVDAWRDAWGRGKKWRELLGVGLRLLDPVIRDHVVRSVGAVRSVVPNLELEFAAPPVRYESGRQILSFWGIAGGHRHRCAVSREALEDNFGAGPEKNELSAAFKANRIEIEGLLSLKYLHAPIVDVEETLLRTDDVPVLREQLRPRRSR